MDERTENLPILQDFVPYRGRCPATAQLQPKNCIKWGKASADHMMPLGNWLDYLFDANFDFAQNPILFELRSQFFSHTKKITRRHRYCLITY